MKTSACFWRAFSILAGSSWVLAGPAVSSIRLANHPQNPSDAGHAYANPSASVGADLVLSAVVSGSAGPLSYQWQFNQQNLLNQTNRSLSLTNAQVADAGIYTVSVTDSSGPAAQSISLSIDPAFEKVTTGPLVTPSGNSAGGIWCDYNLDGLLDLVLFNDSGASVHNPSIFQNSVASGFQGVALAGSTASSRLAQSACFGDYDNDGYPDLYVATESGNLLFHNEGGKSFTQILSGSPVTDSANTTGACWVDYDRDGLLDLFVTRFDPNAKSHSFLYHNQGDGTFASMTNNVLVTDLASSVGAAWADYDNDGLPDVVVAGGRAPNNPLAPNRVYHNEGNGQFTQVTSGSFINDLGYSGAIGWGDYDNDGYLDLFITNIGGKENFLYHNNRDGTFTRITSGAVVSTVAKNSQGCAWGDYDNDGFLDLFVSNSPNSSSEPAVNFLYHNNGDGTFTAVTVGSLVNEFSNSRGCAWADYDNDGFLDLFVARTEDQGSFLYHNRGNSNAWLTVRLRGTASNASAIGAKVRVLADVAGQSRWQMRQINGGTGWDANCELQANFGLGDATNVTTVRIEWPSGTVQELQDVSPKQILVVTEPPSLKVETTTPPQLTLRAGRGASFEIQTSSNLSTWSVMGTGTVTNIARTATVAIPSSSLAKYSFYRAVLH